MKKTVFIHIGAHKTGTSAIQFFLASNRAVLREKGYLYPDTGDFAHDVIPRNILKNSSSDRNQKISEIIKKTILEMMTCPCQKIIISSELFENLNNKDVQKNFLLLRQFIPEDFIVKIIFYARRQDDRLESMYNQRVKQNEIRLEQPLAMFAGNGTRPIFDYNATLSPWKELFGIENIFVRCYEKEQMPEGIFSDFLNTVGLQMTAQFQTPDKYINESLNWDLIELIRICNNHFKNDILFHKFLVQNLQKIPADKKEKQRHQLSPNQRREIVERYAESNAKVAREYLGRTDGRLFYAPMPDPDEPWEPYEGLTAERIVPIFAYMIFNCYKKTDTCNKSLNLKGIRWIMRTRFERMKLRILSLFQ